MMINQDGDGEMFTVNAVKVLLLTSPLCMQGTALIPVGLQGVCRASFRSGKGGSDATMESRKEKVEQGDNGIGDGNWL